jgi:hypothetical protein
MVPCSLSCARPERARRYDEREYRPSETKEIQDDDRQQQPAKNQYEFLSDLFVGPRVPVLPELPTSVKADGLTTIGTGRSPLVCYDGCPAGAVKMKTSFSPNNVLDTEGRCHFRLQQLAS